MMRIIAFSGLTWWAQLCPLITAAWRPLKTQTLKYLIKQREDRDKAVPSFAVWPGDGCIGTKTEED